jgi:hypothetical protein
MLRNFRTLSTAALVLGFAAAHAQQGIQLNTFPTVSVADGRSTTTVTAVIRDAGGRTVPDGTRVVFNTTLGSFRENVVTTSNGIARAVLVAGGIPGMATVTATLLSGDAAPTTLEFEFVGDRKLLSTAQEFIEIVTPGAMQYTSDNLQKVISASAPDKGVSIRYRDILVTADDVQIDIPNYVLRARKARLKFGKIDKDFEELYLRLNIRKGIGTTTFTAKRIDGIGFTGRNLAFFSEDKDGNKVPAQDVERFGVVEIRGGEMVPSTTALNTPYFEFEDVSSVPSTIRAKKAIVFPRKGIQFQKAEVFVGDARVMKMPLFETNLYGNSPLVTDQFVNVNDNQLAINYPHYLSLKPGQTSLLRFRTGERYGRGTQANRGMFLDYELNWNRGDEMDGGLTLSGIGRQDWSLNARQFLRIDDRTTAFLHAEMPAGQSLFGSMGLSRQFDGFQVNLNGNMSRSWRGQRYSNQDLTLVAEKDTTKVGRLPLRLFYGLTSIYNTDSRIGAIQSGTGVYTRLQSLPLPIDKRSNLSASVTARHLSGSNSRGGGMALLGTATMTRRLSSAASVVATYDYTKDNFNDTILGNHRVSLQGYYNAGRTGLRLTGSKSLDVDRISLYGDLDYRVSDTWRLGLGYTLDRYPLSSTVSNTYLDYTFLVGYRIGWREVGLTWSRQTKRIGFQILGATLN